MSSGSAGPDATRGDGAGVDRRGFLQGSLALGVGALGLGSLAACGNGSGQTPNFGATNSGALPYQLARPDHPVTQPVSPDNPAIASGLQPETGGTFQMLNYADYINPKIVKEFGQKYNVQVQLTPYNNYDEMLSKLNQPSTHFDIVFPGPSVISKMVYAKLLQPLNKSYTPNLKNVWDDFQSPFYDVNAQYTVPYTIYTTGIAYRRDRVKSIPANGYDLIWDPQFAGNVYLLDDKGEGIGMSLLRNHITTDVNTGNKDYLDAATNSLIDATNKVNLKVSIQDYVFIPSGQATVAQGWSGDMLAALQYLPKGTSASVLGYWVPDTDFVIGNDLIAIPKGAKKPVLGHLLMNELLSNDGGLTNFQWNGYQPPLTAITADSLIQAGLIPKNLMSAVVRPGDFATGLHFYEVTPDVDALWSDEWARFTSGA